MIRHSKKQPIIIVGGSLTSEADDMSRHITSLIHNELGKQSRLSRLFLTHVSSGTSTNLKTVSDILVLINEITSSTQAQIVFFMPSATNTDQFLSLNNVQLSIRSVRKDLYLVLASSTTGLSQEEQYFEALDLMKSSHANLVLAYDTKTGNNMVVVPEEAFYGQSHNLTETLNWLVKIALARAGENFTRSYVIDAPLVPWNTPQVSQNFRDVVDHLVARGAYKRFRGKTVGHFALRGAEEGEFLTSRRNHDFNKLSEIGLVRVFAKGSDEVTAHGSKPSVGGQSQRIIFNQNPDISSIVHFHSPLRSDLKDAIPVREQWPFECGSHQCGQNTANGLREIIPGVDAVMLENHGPNIVFGNEVPAKMIIDLIERNFDLEAKTGYTPNQRYEDTIIIPRSFLSLQLG